jgi:uncharacterized membrane protein
MKAKCLSARWNNSFSIVLGIIAIIYVIVILSICALGETASFIGLVVIGGFA